MVARWQNLIPSFPWIAPPPPPPLAQSKERKGSKFAICQPLNQADKPPAAEHQGDLVLATANILHPEAGEDDPDDDRVEADCRGGTSLPKRLHQRQAQIPVRQEVRGNPEEQAGMDLLVKFVLLEF